MKPISALTLEDLSSVPVWRYHGGADEDAFVEPTNQDSVSELDDETHIVLTQFTLADGSVHLGYSSPADSSGLDYVQPAIVTEDGHVRFWFDRAVSVAFLVQQWSPLHRREDEIFPIRWRNLVPVDGATVTGTIAKSEVLAQAN